MNSTQSNRQRSSEIKSCCKTCQWWQLPPEGEYWGSEQYVAPDKPWHPDQKMPVDFEVRYCRNPKLLFCERPAESNTFAVADASDYMANLYTAENFGCVLHEDSEQGSGASA